MKPSVSAFDVITAQIADPDAQWSLGTFGAIAEFMREPDEPAEIESAEQSVAVTTPRGGIRLDMVEGLRPLAFETVTTHAWSQRVAFCLPAAAATMSGRAVLTEVGPDDAALRAQERGATLFDLGLGALQVDCCIRTSDPALIEGLRGHAARSLFEPGNPAMGLILSHSPHRVFVTRCGRAEVYQAIPAPGGKAPEGPHTHVLPKLLAHQRTHAATEPIPAGWISCAHLYPAHPLHDGHRRASRFDPNRHVAFQRLLGRFGDSEHLKLKRNVAKAIAAGAAPNAIAMPAARQEQVAIRIALRQVKAINGPSENLAAWFAAHDHASRSDPDEDLDQHA